MLPVIESEYALEAANPIAHLLTNSVSPIKLLQPLRTRVGECKLHGDSGVIRAAHVVNHNATLGHIIRGDGERGDSLDLGKRRNRESDES